MTERYLTALYLAKRHAPSHPTAALPFARHMRLAGLRKIFFAAFLLAMPSLAQAETVNAKDWPALLQKAKGQTVYFNAWAGRIGSMPISIGQQRG